jgi:thymidylate synthase (FAD)
MFRSDMHVELIESCVSDEMVAKAARVSTGTDHSSADPEGLINYLMRDRHGSPFEHGIITFRVEAPIFVWREHMRHRMANYNEESGRYTQLKPDFYIPGPDRNLVQVGKPGAYSFVPGNEPQYLAMVAAIKRMSTNCYAEYQSMLDLGIAREVARMVLPVNIYSSAYVTMNPRALMNFLSLRRKAPESRFPSFPQREIEMVAEKYEDIFEDRMPLTHAAFVNNGRVAP